MTSRGVLPIVKNPLFGRSLTLGNSELRVVLAQFAHDLFDRGEFGVRMSEDCVFELKVGIFARRAMVDQAREGLCYQGET